jgi:hypothetical protein
MASEAPVGVARDARGCAPRADAPSVAGGGDRLRAPAAGVHPYRPRAAEHTVLHRVVRAHLATFLRAADAAGGVPPFVEREFRQFLGCGVWAQGFARFRCDACHTEVDPDAPGPTKDAPWHARHAGFDLHAGRIVRADDRAGLERLCHYLCRPPLAQERLELLPDGRVGLTLAHPWSDGTRALVFDGVEFLEKLAVLIPKPRINLVVYHGILAPRARDRTAAVARAVPLARAGADANACPADASGPPSPASPSRRAMAWADLLRRIFAIDVLACACGGRLRFVATIEDPSVVQRILRHLGLPTDAPVPEPARPPPGADAELAFDFPG